MDDIITADEFWVSHAPEFLVANTPAKVFRQDTGVSSGFLVRLDALTRSIIKY